MMIDMRNIYKVYGKGENQFQALRDINLFIGAGEFVSVVGESGCGKSTLLNIIGLMDHYSVGEYCFQGEDTGSLKGRPLARFRGKNIGFVFQAFCLIPELNLLENVSVALGYQGVPRKERQRIAESLLVKVGLKDKIKRRPGQLSGGEQQRVAIARALSANPSIILADEPTGNLDRNNSKEVMKLLASLNEKGTTVIMVTHSQDEAKEANRMLYMSDGRIIKDETG